MKMTTIKLQEARVDQLKRVAAAYELASVSDVIGLFINREIEAEKIASGLSGIDIRREGTNVFIDVGAWKRTIEPGFAKEVADAIAQTSGFRPGALRNAMEPTPPSIVADHKASVEAEIKAAMMPAAINARRCARHVELLDEQSGKIQTVSISIAADIAKLIDDAAS